MTLQKLFNKINSLLELLIYHYINSDFISIMPFSVSPNYCVPNFFDINSLESGQYGLFQ